MNEENKEESMNDRLEKKFPFFFCIHQSMISEFVNSEIELALKSQQERLVGEIEKHCYESEEKEKDFCALQGRIGLRNEIIEIIKKQ